MKVSRSRPTPIKIPKLPLSAEIFEVGPRDGLQAESQTLTLAQKIELVEKLMAAGLRDIEVGSFIKPGVIPQLNESDRICEILNKKYSKRQTRFWAFVPNLKGLELAAQSGVDGASFFTTTSDTFAFKNVNTNVDDLLKKLPPMLKEARRLKIKNRVYLSTLVHCAYEGVIKPQKVLQVVSKILDAGATEVALSDTTGHADPKSLHAVLDLLLKKFPANKFALHLHDTHGLALTNVLVGLEYGIRRYDSSVAGTGGCPFAPGASGNLSTEDLANMLVSMKLLKNVDMTKLGEAGFFMERAFARRMPSKMLRALEVARTLKT